MCAFFSDNVNLDDFVINQGVLDFVFTGEIGIVLNVSNYRIGFLPEGDNSKQYFHKTLNGKIKVLV